MVSSYKLRHFELQAFESVLNLRTCDNNIENQVTSLPEKEYGPELYSIALLKSQVFIDYTKAVTIDVCDKIGL